MSRPAPTPTVDDRPVSALRLVEDSAVNYRLEDLVDAPVHRAFGDLRFTREQLERMDAKVVRKLAQYATSDAINGRSTRLEVHEFFGVQRTLGEYE